MDYYYYVNSLACLVNVNEVVVGGKCFCIKLSGKCWLLHIINNKEDHNRLKNNYYFLYLLIIWVIICIYCVCVKIATKQAKIRFPINILDAPLFPMQGSHLDLLQVCLFLIPANLTYMKSL